MKHVVSLTILLMAALPSGARAADTPETPPEKSSEKPPESVFLQSEFEFSYKLPPSFGSPHVESGYLATPMGKVPYRIVSITDKGDSIAIKSTVMPEEWWQTRSSNAFAEAKESLAGNPKIKVISERNYSLSGCQAYSMTITAQGSKPLFQRIDYFLVKPDLRVIIYATPNESALTDTTCRQFFESILINPKKK